MNSKLFKFCLSAILALSFNACGGDNNDDDDNKGDGGNSNAVKCKPGDVICSPDLSSTLVCNAAGNGYEKKDNCDKGCENNACRGSGGGGNASVCTANATVCQNNQLKTCNADGSGFLSNPENCPSGCVDGASSCNNNVNLVEDAGEECDTSRADRCDGTVISYCDPDYDVVVAGDCADYYGADAVCGVVAGSANCYKPEDACTTVNAETKGCYDYVTDDVTYRLAVTYVCTQTSAGKFNIMDPYDYDICSGGCVNGECLKLVDDEGEKCNSSRADRCDGTVLSYCYENVVFAGDCVDYYGKGSVCGIVDGAANCYKSEDACTVSGSEKKGCYDYVSEYGTYKLAVNYVCTQTSAGKYYVMDGEDYDICDSSCRDGECVSLVDDEGEDCDSSRVDACNDGVLSYCNDPDGGVVTVLDCTEYDGYSCVILNDGYGNCFNAESECSKVGDKKYACSDEYEGYELSYEYECVAAPNGKKYWEYRDFDWCNQTDVKAICNASTGKCTK